MREYLFRSKREDNGEWVYGWFYFFEGACIRHCHQTCHPDEGPQNAYTDYEVIPETVGQYTGLKDKGGKMIFEGDVLRGFQKQQKDKDGKFGFVISDIVRFSRGGFTVFSKNMQSGYARDNNVLYQFMWCEPGSLADHYYQIDDIEVIGNIHDVIPPADSPALNTMYNIDPPVKQEEQEASEQAAQQAAEENQANAQESEGTEG